MRRTLLPLLSSLSLLLGCAQTPTTQEGDGDEGGGEQVTTSEGDEVAVDGDTARAPGACPQSYGDSSPTCANGDFPVDCTYPEGACGCRRPTYCGGAAPPPMPLRWICEATPAPCPEAGSPCSGSGRCSSQPCGWEGVACENGVFRPYVQSPPP